ncbi:MAG: cobalamin biosynthesis protein [Methylotenera sp. 24-45-7]|jgi:adenosylcobinamide-phosphate synthase|nr:MAG: cobalamin biosynthesis protein [Mehylophilales bacterium 35-46-6]OYZ40419.1 MAG: cobalamin biosynthesis protein [Methylotenera sp. 24-45-7]OZA09362.1 MAG: cobalamin biosynthesis protein [Methylotenera sp. 17-45-7]HQS44327.1 adenosylcobinamide-phosphate synthase CbiB [Methylotenera sp.]
MSFDYYPIFASTHLALGSAACALITALLLDHVLGEPKRWHPLVGFGWLANKTENMMNKFASPLGLRISGLFAWLLLLAPFMAISYVLSQGILGWIIDVLLLYFSVGARSLGLHAKQIEAPLTQGNLAAARHAVGMIVSRDTTQLNATEISTATVESVLENGNDAIFGAIFWFLLLGGTGALMFRLANTLDAMWGYRTPRFQYFGWAAARLDDLLNLIPARLTALSYALCGHTRTAIQCWHSQAHTWYSPNAGPVMAAGAGAMQVKLGGAASYYSQIKQRPVLGLGQSPAPKHILSAIKLVNRSIILWCACIVIATLIRGLYFA